jgi:large subunit ribosomal protein L15
MSILSSLKPAEGSKHYTKRVGRGHGSGLGGTAAKGHKGQLARTGGKVRRGFEGGQTPIMRRLPKFGFSNVKFATEYSIVNLAQLNKLTGDISPESLKKSGLISSDRVKVLGNGTLTKALSIKAHGFSDAAKAAIEKAGGKIEVLK